LMIIVFISQSNFGQTEVKDKDFEERMTWFKEAKLGIFIHWGIYAVNGISESWSFHNEYVTHEEYMKQLNGFTAEAYHPEQWAEVIKKSGATYAVITSKHHDGVALWDTKENHYSTVRNTPAGRDLLQPFVRELRKHQIKVGLYYSLIDWSHPDYPNFTRTEKRYEKDSLRWERFTEFNHAQIREISTQFNPDLVWFDGDWEFDAKAWKAKDIQEMLHRKNKDIVINSRLAGYGDYDTPENGLPVYPPSNPYWELCMTSNDSWGYQQNDKNYKTTNQVIQVFADCISKGGNLLLDIGPDAKGNIPEEQITLLTNLGGWISKHEKAIFGTHAGIPSDCFYGPSTLSADSTILYLFLNHVPRESIALKGIGNSIHRAWVVGNGTRLSVQVHNKPYWSDKPGLVFIEVPEYVCDPQMTVVAVLLDGKIRFERK
jgi:alpha-L-fucosidase